MTTSDPGAAPARALLGGPATGVNTRDARAGTELARDPEVREALYRESRDRIFSEGAVAELFHVGLAAIVALLARDFVPATLLLPWFVIVSGAVLVRALQRHRLRTHPFDRRARAAFRADVTTLALAWGAGAGAFVHWLPFRDVALMLVMVSGIVAAAAATLAADTLAFRLFLGAMLGPFALGILAEPLDRSRIAALSLIGIFALAMTVLHRKAHAGLVLSVTARIRLAESEAAAAREHAHLSALFASAPVATAVVTSAGVIEDVNPHFESLFGYSAAEARGRLLNELIVPPAERGRAEQLDGTVLGGETLVVEVERRRKDGEPVLVRASAARVEGTQERGLFVLYEDISDEVRARAALREAKDTAERVAQMRSAFLANMSHEIRTPMNAVLGLAELLLDSELAPEQRRSLNLIQASGETLLTLLNDILDLSKIEAESLHLEAVPFDLPRLVDSTISLLAVRARERGIELMADFGIGVPEQVRGDPTRLRQVLTNLVSNAVKFTHEGEIVVSVRHQGPGRGQGIRFAVRDTGIGISEEQRARIFQPFTQADLSMTRKYGGTGLGLTIAKRLVEMMGGTLEVKSEVGRGSEFSFAVDVIVDDTLPPPLPSADAVPLRGRRILVVDDNQSNRRIVRGLLSTVGVEVDEASSADEGLGAMHRAATAGAPYALAVLDAQMPGRDGFDLGRDVRADPALKGTRLLMLTSAGQRGDAQRCRDLGIHGYLTKPVSRADLLDMVAGILGRAEAEVPAGHEVVTRHRIHESRRHLTILLAEDNLVNQEVAATMLRKRGHTVDVASNGREAVDRVAAKRYDVVLMDVQMPVMDGLAATAAIRATPGASDLPVVALTAHALSDERDKCTAAGMNGFVIKPFKGFELFAAVEGWGRRTDPGAAAAQAAEVAGAGALPAVPPVALDAFRRDMEEAGASEAVDGIVGSFVASTTERVASLSRAVEGDEPGEASRLAHMYRSSAAQIGAHRLAEILQDMEQAGKDGKLDRLRTKAVELREEADRVVEYLKSETKV
jgi:two-component system sensor histidine kinase/response regulator